MKNKKISLGIISLMWILLANGQNNFNGEWSSSTQSSKFSLTLNQTNNKAIIGQHCSVIFVEDIQKSNYTKFRLRANTVEWINGDQPYNQPITNTLSIQNGSIVFN